MKHTCLMILVAGLTACGGVPTATTATQSTAPAGTTNTNPVPAPVSDGNATTVTQTPNTVTTTNTNTTTPATTASQVGFTITAANDPNLCVDIAGLVVDGAPLALATCNGNSTQRFVMENWELKSISGKCVATSDDTMTNYGENMVVRGCDNSVGQHWALYQGMIYATPANSNQWVAVGVQADNVVAQASIVLVKYDASDSAQRWALNVTVPGAKGMQVSGFPIAATSFPTACMTAVNGVVGSKPCAASAAQLWSFDSQGELVWRGNAADCIDISPATAANIINGTQATVQACDNASTQHWLISNGDFVQSNYALEIAPAPSATGFSVGDMNSNAFLWSFGRGFATP